MCTVRASDEDRESCVSGTGNDGSREPLLPWDAPVHAPNDDRLDILPVLLTCELMIDSLWMSARR